MGRYDKIRGWDGYEWFQPSQMKIWNGTTWVDLGTNGSQNTKPLYAWDGSEYKRFTKNYTYHAVDHYLQYAGGDGIVLPDGYQWYNAKYEFIVTPSAVGNYILVETATSGQGNYCRLGLYVDGSTFYAYATIRYNNGTAKEVNTKSKGSLSAGVKYKITLEYLGEAKVKLTVYNYSTGATWEVANSSMTSFYGSSCGTRLLAGYTQTGRNFYGNMYSAYVQGCKNSTTPNNALYNVNSTAAGASALALTSSSSAGGVTATSPTHHGTVYDPSYVTWE